MESAEQPEVTRLLRAWQSGDKSALEQLTVAVHDALKHIAQRHMRGERAEDILQATALVNELYLRLEDVKGVDWQRRDQFYSLSAQIMRNILVDAARARGTAKRGRDAVRVPLEEATLQTPAPDEFLLDLNDALTAFAQIAPRQAKVVEMRYFGGMTEEETAEVLKISVRTVRRDWQFARAWLLSELGGSGATAAD